MELKQKGRDELLSKMKKLLVIATIFLFIVACNSETGSEGNGGFLWKVNHGGTELYLQGTIHVGDESFYPLNDYSEEAYAAADVIMPEVDLNNVDFVETQRLIMENATYENDETIEDYISAESYEKLTEIFAKYGVPDMTMLQIYQPWYLELLMTTFSLQTSGYDAEFGVDQYFLDRAEEDGKQVVELESFEEQVDVLAGFSLEQQAIALTAAIDNFDQMEEELEQLVGHWLEGNLDGLELPEEQYEGFDEYMRALNEVRNIDMAEKLDQILAEDSGQTYFVIVGALHFVEEPSIISILEEKGYEVEHIY